MIPGVSFIPPIQLSAGDMMIPRGVDTVGVYRPAPDGFGWELDVVYTFQDGAYRIIIDGPPLRKELAGEDPNDHADPQIDG